MRGNELVITGTIMMIILVIESPLKMPACTLSLEKCLLSLNKNFVGLVVLLKR
jgi:hypothetical protein